MQRPRPIVWLRTHPRGADAILAAIVTFVAVTAHVLGETSADDEPMRDPAWWTVALVVLSTAPIYWRRIRTIESGLVVVAAQVVALLVDAVGAPFLGSAVAVYSIGAHTTGVRRGRTLAAVAVMVLGLFIAGWIDDRNLVGEFVSTGIVLITAYVLGDNLRRRREHVDSLAERAARLEREQALLAEQQVTAERARIARELHDVVAHSVSVMVIQAAAARRTLHTAPDSAAAALSTIEETGRRTMTELRGILGVLRKDAGDGGRATDPQPTLDDVPGLLDAVDDLPTVLRIDDAIGELPSSVELTGYRVIQEALTNVRRHAGPVERVEIEVALDRDHLVVSVTDDGRGAAADHAGPGYGIVGMRERVVAIGGTVVAGPRRGGGWRVAATIPVEPVLARDQERAS